MALKLLRPALTSIETRPPRIIKTGLILCDVWNAHWCRSASEGMARLAWTIAPVVDAFRRSGAQIIHAPSDTMSFYRDHPARRWVLDLASVTAPAERPVSEPLLPLPTGGFCTDDPICLEPSEPPWPWTRQHPAIEIFEEDAILDSGERLIAVMEARSLDSIIICGTHTNKCVLNRSFGIKQMTRWGIHCLLLRDFTEAIPADFTEAAITHIAEHWCPTINVAEALASASPPEP
jgi:nicotinamidase-related amidase